MCWAVRVVESFPKSSKSRRISKYRKLPIAKKRGKTALFGCGLRIGVQEAGGVNARGSTSQALLQRAFVTLLGPPCPDTCTEWRFGETISCLVVLFPSCH